MKTDGLIRRGVPLLLGLLVLFSPRPWDRLATESPSINLPWDIAGRTGVEVLLNQHAEEVLAGSHWLSRGYWRVAPDENEIIWVNMAQSADIGRLHNYYDSLLASGARPFIAGQHRISVDGHTLEATHIRYQSTSGKPSHMLYWYEAGTATAANRWNWYGEILRLRLQGKNPPWRLVEVATLAGEDESADLERLTRFIRAMKARSDKGPKPHE